MHRPAPNVSLLSTGHPLRAAGPKNCRHFQPQPQSLPPPPPPQVQQLLDDHQTLTQGLQFSPFKKIFEQQIDEWDGHLRLMNKILEVPTAMHPWWFGSLWGRVA